MTAQTQMTADEIIALLRLRPHPEGGWYRQTWADTNEGRSHGTCIYFLLKAGERSHWHRVVDATEFWIYNAGAPVALSLSETDQGPATEIIVGPDLVAGQRPQGMVPANWWQAARSTGEWSLVSCTVSPGFLFEKFVLAAPDFDIPRA